MTWEEMDAGVWLDETKEAVGRLDAPAGPGIARFDLVRSPDDSAAIHRGPLRVGGDFTPPALLTLVEGDLDVAGRVSTQGVDGADGNATLVVLGNLTCGSLVNDWASLILISGHLKAREWVFTAREDSSILVGGDFDTPIFIGEDIAVSIGGTARMRAGFGYAAPMDMDGVENRLNQIRPQIDEAGTARMLGLEGDQFDWTEAVETRLYETGTILPPQEN